MVNLTFEFFGRSQATLNGRKLFPLSSLKAQGLLSYLLIDPVFNPKLTPTRDSLILLLWPDMPEKSARKNLRQTT